MNVYLTLSILVRVLCTGQECPPWFIFENSSKSTFPQCVCSEASDTSVICNQRKRTSFLKLGHCMFQDDQQYGTVATSCPYLFPSHLIEHGKILLPQNVTYLNSFICGQLRRETGALFCGKCSNGTGPSIHSFGRECTECSGMSTLYYFILLYVPTTIIFLAILLFRCNLASPPMAHYIMYCNILALALRNHGHKIMVPSANAYMMKIIRLLLTVDSIWVLDPLYFISPPLCISDNIHETYFPVLDTIAAAYPFILLLLTYSIIELHSRDSKAIVFIHNQLNTMFRKLFVSWHSEKSLIQAFATLFLLSFMKFLAIGTDPFLLASVTNMSGNVVAHVSYIDPTITFFSHQHLTIVVISGTVLAFILLPPILLLTFYPTKCFRKVSKRLKPRWLLTIKIFTDTFHGSYKDGTNGTRDYRPVAGLIFATWFLFCAINALLTLSLKITYSWVNSLIALLLVLMIGCIVFEPYKHRAANVSGAVLPIILITAGVCMVSWKHTHSQWEYRCFAVQF